MFRIRNCIISLCVLFITFFSFSIFPKSANFAYSDFNWDEIIKKNTDFWTGLCEGKEDCVDKVLKTKQGFYERLYNLLDTVQKKVGYIDDNTIIATVFYGLTPDSFSDPSDDKYNPYKIDTDENSKNKYIADVDGDIEGARKYFEEETDSLKTLVNSFIGYKSDCYGITDKQPSFDQNSNTYSCPDNLIYRQEKCQDKVDTFKGTFFDSIGLSFFKKNNAKNKCENLITEKGYSDFDLEVSSTKEIDEEFFYKFLEENDYFDRKDHLQSYFDVVLQNTGYENMTDFYNSDTFKNATDEELEKYNKEIVRARKAIIAAIKDVLRIYGEKSTVSKDYASVCNSNTTYWWPIGGSNIVDAENIKTASDDPVTTDISSEFGERDNPTSSGKQNHKGIDIPATGDKVPVIAVQSGNVVFGKSDTNGKCVTGDSSCGGGYGNYVIIEHSDGNYTLYAHMATDSIIVNNGDSVKQGQVIGYVGSTGNSTGSHLHFEVRKGGKDSNSVDNPLNYVDPKQPRSATSCSAGSAQIVLPDEFGNAGYFTYTEILKFNWAYDQKKVYNVWKQSGSQNDRGIATIDGRYLIACTTTFGNVGDKVDFYLGNGMVLPTIIFDVKSQEYVAWDHNPANKWGHENGQQIIEFEIISRSPLNGSGDAGRLIGITGQRVAGATNLNENVIK